MNYPILSCSKTLLVDHEKFTINKWPATQLKEVSKLAMTSLCGMLPAVIFRMGPIPDSVLPATDSPFHFSHFGLSLSSLGLPNSGFVPFHYSLWRLLELRIARAVRKHYFLFNTVIRKVEMSVVSYTLKAPPATSAMQGLPTFDENRIRRTS